MNMIAAVDIHHGIGMDGHMLYAIPEDLRRFREMTLCKAVVMGRGTFDALPGASALPGRTNIVLTRDKDWKADNCTVCHSLQELWRAVTPFQRDDVFVIGGESVYTQLMDYCAKAYITRIFDSKPADRFFPKIEEDVNWALVKESEMKEYNGVRFCYQEYVNNRVKPITP